MMNVVIIGNHFYKYNKLDGLWKRYDSESSRNILNVTDEVAKLRKYQITFMDNNMIYYRNTSVFREIKKTDYVLYKNNIELRVDIDYISYNIRGKIYNKMLTDNSAINFSILIKFMMSNKLNNKLVILLHRGTCHTSLLLNLFHGMYDTINWENSHLNVIREYDTAIFRYMGIQYINDENSLTIYKKISNLFTSENRKIPWIITYPNDLFDIRLFKQLFEKHSEQHVIIPGKKTVSNTRKINQSEAKTIIFNKLIRSCLNRASHIT